jgi:hypothetical protein
VKGILFKPYMVKAIMDGRKTQTRRLAGLEKINKNPDGWELSMWEGKPTTAVNGVSIQVIPKPLIVGGDVLTALKPRYLPGETVYVKETYCCVAGDDEAGDPVLYALNFDDRRYMEDLKHTGSKVRWHSPMMMPQCFARTFLSIKDARPERLQAITELDAEAEGISDKSFMGIDGVCHAYDHGYYVCTYEALWDSINKKPGTRWQDNPWVWRYVFEVRKP